MPERGLVFGNRGCLHDDRGEIRRQWQGARWIACRLEFRGRKRGLLRPGRYTELFFLDEATALAAGHRPCAECRRPDYEEFLRRCVSETRARSAEAVDERLHAERLDGRARRLHLAPYDELPDGAFVLEGGAPRLVLGDRLLAWSPGGYGDPRPRPSGEAALHTPPLFLPLLGAEREPLVPFLHPSAFG